jgi:hypothetical protein
VERFCSVISGGSSSLCMPQPVHGPSPGPHIMQAGRQARGRTWHKIGGHLKRAKQGCELWRQLIAQTLACSRVRHQARK